MEDDFGPDHRLKEEFLIGPKAYEPAAHTVVARGRSRASDWRAMWRTLQRPGLALGAAVLLAASCGGPQPTRSGAIAKWDATCRATHARLSNIRIPAVTSGTDLQPFASAMQRALPIVIQELERLGAVTVPPGDQKTADRILTDLERAVDQLHQAERSATQRNLAATKSAITRSQTYTAASSALARAYGFRVCGHSSGSGSG